MTGQTKRKLGAFGLRGAGLASSVGIPAAAVMSAFPLFERTEGGQVTVDTVKIGVGGIMIILILLVGLRRQVWPLIQARLHFTAGWVLVGWGLMFALLMGIEKIIPLLPDLRSICLAGLTGTGIGQIADTAAGFVDPTSKKAKEVNES